MANGHGGKRKNAGAKKGQPKTAETKLLREAVILAATSAGEKIDPETEDGLIAYLEKQANDQPAAFMGLLGRVLPLQLASGDKPPGGVAFVWLPSSE